MTRSIDRRRALGVGAGAVAALTAGGARAQAWPNKPIRWIVPYTPGGITDATTRIVAEKLTAALGQNIVVENRPGANSLIGAEAAAKATPDGYTFITVIAGHSANATLYAGKLSFDPVKSFAPVSLMGIAPLILTANNDFPPKDVKQLIDYAKANPSKISYGSSGVGAAAHLTTELIKQTAGIEMTHVPYRGTAPALQDLIGGSIQVLIDAPSSMMPQVRAGKVRALAMLSKERLEVAKEVPTMVEAGGPPIESATWMMALAPANTPRDIVDRMSKEVAKIVETAEIKERFATMGIIPGGYDPARTGQFLADEVARWAKVIETAGVKPEQ
ncbi:MAG TPA: tripartite tricarboxylate transporter substrate binding protein [Vineibacter sp.]|nr:tripartite tricarboxylate transporter substrate binding protein [Vineibacter sp.]